MLCDVVDKCPDKRLQVMLPTIRRWLVRASGGDMGKDTGWVTPFKKQCFVSLGVCLNMAAHGLVMGFAAVLLPQLKRGDSLIPIDDAQGSWIASILGFALVAGNFIVPTVMARCGRRAANLASVAPMLLGWLGVAAAGSVRALLAARFLHGVSMGMSASLGPVLIGEYTSPKNRGAFLTFISLTIATGVLTVHTMGSFMTWQKTALVCSAIVFVDLLIVIYSPETPSWLADQGRYDESRKVFRWLRGDSEEDELQRIIETSMIIRESKAEISSSETLGMKIRRNIVYVKMTIRKKEFYKPIFIMMHIYTLGQWSGANILVSYTVTVFDHVVGEGTNVALLLISLGVQRLISNSCAVIVIKKVKRRTMLLATVSINIIACLSTAAYTYAKAHNMLLFDHPMLGILLVHLHMFSIATGTVPLPFIIAGELFPLEYRSLAGGISVLFLSANMFITVKTVPLLFATVGLHGAYCLYAGVVAYCLLVAWRLLPETKDRTLQDIEDGFRGGPRAGADLAAATSLTSLQLYHRDRRCSSPII